MSSTTTTRSGASLVMGQSNLAAGARSARTTNSRANDGESRPAGVLAGTVHDAQHSSEFASFVLVPRAIIRGVDVPLPFSLVSNDEAHDRLLVMPAIGGCTTCTPWPQCVEDSDA